MSDVRVTDNRQAERYEAKTGDGLAFAAYRPAGHALMFTHTEVPEGVEGQGIGSSLVKYALDDVRARGLKVIPACQFVAAYIERHPEYQDLVQS